MAQDKIEGGIGASEKRWYVLKPGRHSELVDIVYGADFEDLCLMIRGGDGSTVILASYEEQEDAENHGQMLLDGDDFE